MGSCDLVRQSSHRAQTHREIGSVDDEETALEPRGSEDDDETSPHSARTRIQRGIEV